MRGTVVLLYIEFQFLVGNVEVAVFSRDVSMLDELSCAYHTERFALFDDGVILMFYPCRHDIFCRGNVIRPNDELILDVNTILRLIARFVVIGIEEGCEHLERFFHRSFGILFESLFLGLDILLCATDEFDTLDHFYCGDMDFSRERREELHFSTFGIISSEIHGSTDRIRAHYNHGRLAIGIMKSDLDVSDTEELLDFFGTIRYVGDVDLGYAILFDIACDLVSYLGVVLIENFVTFYRDRFLVVLVDEVLSPCLYDSLGEVKTDSLTRRYGLGYVIFAAKDLFHCK